MRARAAAAGVVFFAVCAGLAAQPRADAMAEFRRGNLERAVEIGLADVALNHRNVEAYIVLCWSLLGLGRHDEAMRFANMARAVNRHDPRVIGILGEVYFHLGNNGDALRYLQSYVTIASDVGRTHEAYFLMGEIFIRTGRFGHADIALSKAAHMRPGNALWWARLAFARENSGDFLRAVEAYERALALNPRLADARRGLDRVRVALAGR